jgi:hypothetical protein
MSGVFAPPLRPFNLVRCTIKANPKAAEELGLSAEDIEAAKKTDSKESDAAKPMKASDPVPGDGAVEGLDPEVAKALEHPQVRQAIAEELGKAEQSQQQYAAAVNYARSPLAVC